MQILLSFGLPRSPKVVVMNFYEGNDLRDAARDHDHREAGAIGPPRESSESSNFSNWRHSLLARNSDAFNLVGGAAAYLLAKREKRDQASEVDFRYRLVDGDRAVEFNPHNSDRDEVLFARRLVSGEIEVTLFDGALERFSSLAISHDFLPVLVYSPSAHTAYRTHVVFEDESNRELLEVYNRMLRSYLSARASNLGLVFVDLTEPFLEAAEEIELDRLYYYPTSMHFTARAHALVAEVLAEALESKPDLASDSPQLRVGTSLEGALLE